MKRPVFVTVTGAGPGEKPSVSAGPGTREDLPDGTCVIVFREQPEGSDETFSTTVTAAPDSLVIERTGSVSCRFVFAEGQTHPAEYVTPYGTAFLRLRTDRLQVRAGTAGLFAAVRFALFSEENGPAEDRQVTVRAMGHGKIG